MDAIIKQRVEHAETVRNLMAHPGQYKLGIVNKHGATYNPPQGSVVIFQDHGDGYITAHIPYCADFIAQQQSKGSSVFAETVCNYPKRYIDEIAAVAA